MFVHSVVMVEHLLRAGHWEAFLPSSYLDRLQMPRMHLCFWTFISHLVECMLDTRQKAQYRGDRGEGDMLLSGICSHLALPAITSDSPLLVLAILRGM